MLRCPYGSWFAALSTVSSVQVRISTVSGHHFSRYILRVAIDALIAWFVVGAVIFASSMRCKDTGKALHSYL